MKRDYSCAVCSKVVKDCQCPDQDGIRVESCPHCRAVNMLTFKVRRSAVSGIEEAVDCRIIVERAV
jgi:hypothetical protein